MKTMNRCWTNYGWCYQILYC